MGSRSFISAFEASLGSSRRATAKITVPTGLLGLPPSGPATPVIATATSALLRLSAPFAIAQATAIETAPKVSMRSGETPSISCLASFE